MPIGLHIRDTYPPINYKIYFLRFRARNSIPIFLSLFYHNRDLSPASQSVTVVLYSLQSLEIVGLEAG